MRRAHTSHTAPSHTSSSMNSSSSLALNSRPVISLWLGLASRAGCSGSGLPEGGGIAVSWVSSWVFCEGSIIIADQLCHLQSAGSRRTCAPARASRHWYARWPQTYRKAPRPWESATRPGRKNRVWSTKISGGRRRRGEVGGQDGRIEEGSRAQGVVRRHDEGGVLVVFRNPQAQRLRARFGQPESRAPDHRRR